VSLLVSHGGAHLHTAPGIVGTAGLSARTERERDRARNGPRLLSDAWVFSSIAGTGPDDGYTLAEIIAHADVINHAIVTEAEFIRAVPRLVAAGLIGAQPEVDRYWRTEKGQALYRQRMKRRGLFGWIDAIPPALHKLGQPQDAAWSVPAGTFERATKDYIHRANTTLGGPGVQLKDQETLLL